MAKLEPNNGREELLAARIKDLEIALEECLDFMTTLYINVQYVDMGYDERDFIRKNYNSILDFNTKLLKTPNTRFYRED